MHATLYQDGLPESVVSVLEVLRKGLRVGFTGIRAAREPANDSCGNVAFL